MCPARPTHTRRVHVCLGRLRRRTAGFTLVEVLVALVIVSVGLLGVAMMHVVALRSARTGLHRAHAVALAADLIERIRANAAPPGAYGCGDPCDATTAGSPLARTTLADWLDRVAATLPDGHGAVVGTAAAPATPAAYAITLHWIEADASVPATLTLRLALAAQAPP